MSPTTTRTTRRTVNVSKCGPVCSSIRDNTLILLVAIGIAGGFMFFAALGSWINYLWYKPLIDVVDPATIQWFHWFFWSDDIVDAALWLYYPNIWWGITIVVAILIAIFVFIVVKVSE